MEDRTKQCRGCGKSKPGSEYYAAHSTRDHLAPKCKLCYRAEVKARHTREQERQAQAKRRVSQ